jgi:hypothetical protein
VNYEFRTGGSLWCGGSTVVADKRMMFPRRLYRNFIESEWQKAYKLFSEKICKATCAESEILQ